MLLDGGQHEVAIHWIQGTFLINSGVTGEAELVPLQVKQLAQYVANATRETLEYCPGVGLPRGIYWEHSARFGCGSILAWHYESNGFWRVFLSIPGQVCERLGLMESARLVTGLKCHFGFAATRVDAKVRVSSWILTPQQAYQEGIQGNLSRVFDVSEQTSTVKGYTSMTAYFGSKGSNARTRIYDPYHNHGVIGGTDIEAELKDEKAKEFVNVLADLYQTAVDEKDFSVCEQYVAGCAVGQVDFLDRSTGKRASRCERCSWWQLVLDTVGTPCRVVGAKETTSLINTAAWAVSQVVPALAALKRLTGGENLMSWLSVQINKVDNLSGGMRQKVNQAKIDGFTFNQVVRLATCA
ncbi:MULTISPECIES: replication initiation factor domain-containing protein [unclassified Synechocystis]|uniref:replication initiation factor domain-containing protein n=2 Tax=Bacteria TaxID=2 RepID=UPI0011D226E9|nr:MULTISPECIES: replication initiation factor domain-containing protein [unclassified Synechocystis]QWO82635.1 replication initiation factor domain-containing protein [Synechocystis sp. PCC 6803]